MPRRSTPTRRRSTSRSKVPGRWSRAMRRSTSSSERWSASDPSSTGESSRGPRESGLLRSADDPVHLTRLRGRSWEPRRRGRSSVQAVSVLSAAVAGDEQAFVQLTAPLRRRLHVHCYRILGSVHDADDALQETMLRAWRGIGRFEPRAELSSWLYRIATNVCLRMLEQRQRTPTAVDAHLEPYPDVLLEPQT